MGLTWWPDRGGLWFSILIFGSGVRWWDRVSGVLPIVADGEAGFGGALNVYELQKAMIAAGVGVYFFFFRCV